MPEGKVFCPLHCRLRQSAADDKGLNGSTPDEVDWAGLPVNLDLVFSQLQRDKVYAQHLKLRHGGRLWRWSPNAVRACACDIAADDQLVHGAADSVPSL